MNKEDFIRDLTETLQGEVTDYELNDSIGYYRDYFNQEMLAGKTEEEILEELGSPKLIGRSIIDARGIDEMAEREEHSYSSYGNNGDRAEYSPQEEDSVGTSLSKIGKNIVTVLVVVAVLIVVFALARVMLPFILGFVVIWWFMSLFQGK